MSHVSRCQNNVKLLKRCKMSKNQTVGPGRKFTKYKLTKWGSQMLMSILTSHTKAIKVGQKYFLYYSL